MVLVRPSELSGHRKVTSGSTLISGILSENVHDTFTIYTTRLQFSFL